MVILQGVAAHGNPEIAEKYPQLFEAAEDLKKIFRDPPELCAQTCAYLASGQAKELRGCYFDCRQDIERVKVLGRERIDKEELMTLKMQFLEGYSNEP